MGVLDACGVDKNHDFWPVFRFILCCQCCDRQVLSTQCRRTVESCWYCQSLLMAGDDNEVLMMGGDDEVFITRNLSVTLWTTERHLTVRSGKFEAEVTNNRRVRSTAPGIVSLKLTTDRHKALHGLSVTAELLATAGDSSDWCLHEVMCCVHCVRTTTGITSLAVWSIYLSAAVLSMIRRRPLSAVTSLMTTQYRRQILLQHWLRCWSRFRVILFVFILITTTTKNSSNNSVLSSCNVGSWRRLWSALTVYSNDASFHYWQLHVPCGCGADMEQFTTRRHVTIAANIQASLQDSSVHSKRLLKFCMHMMILSCQDSHLRNFMPCPCSLVTLSHHNQFMMMMMMMIMMVMRVFIYKFSVLRERRRNFSTYNCTRYSRLCECYFFETPYSNSKWLIFLMKPVLSHRGCVLWWSVFVCMFMCRW